MMDGKSIRKKLIGNDEQRAVSPVIGVILMVAITVILAAVIAAFVLDMSPGGQPVNAAVDTEVDTADGEIVITLNDAGNADEFFVRADDDVFDGSTDKSGTWEFDGTGDTVDLTDTSDVDPSYSAGFGSTDTTELRIIAVSGDDESEIASVDVEYDALP